MLDWIRRPKRGLQEKDKRVMAVAYVNPKSASTQNSPNSPESVRDGSAVPKGKAGGAQSPLGRAKLTTEPRQHTLVNELLL